MRNSTSCSRRISWKSSTANRQKWTRSTGNGEAERAVCRDREGPGKILNLLRTWTTAKQTNEKNLTPPPQTKKTKLLPPNHLASASSLAIYSMALFCRKTEPSPWVFAISYRTATSFQFQVPLNDYSKGKELEESGVHLLSVNVDQFWFPLIDYLRELTISTDFLGK